MLMTARGKELRTQDNDVYENAYLQLELQECFLQLERKDEAIQEHKRVID
jgi:hypothetical protein